LTCKRNIEACPYSLEKAYGKNVLFLVILSFRNLNSSWKRGKEGHGQAAGTSKVQTQSLSLCQLEKIHTAKQLHNPPAPCPGSQDVAA